MTAVVLALNPSIDAEWRTADVLWEEKNNVQSERRWAGGKGINVARWLKHLGGHPQLLLPLGGATGRELACYLRQERIPSRVTWLREPTRVNVIVTTSTGRQMRFNPLGPQLVRAEWNDIAGEVLRRSARAGLLILSGSLPRGVPIDAYARLVRQARQRGLKSLLDCDGPPFAAAVTARPFLVKPNEHELAQWWGRPLKSEAGILAAARALSAKTRGWVLVSRGDKPAVLLNIGNAFAARLAPPAVKPRNTVGAGDALFASVALEILRGTSPDGWLRAGLAAGTAATQCEPGQLPAQRC